MNLDCYATFSFNEKAHATLALLKKPKYPFEQLFLVAMRIVVFSLLSVAINLSFCFAGSYHKQQLADSVALVAEVPPQFIEKPKLEFPIIALEAGVVGKIWVKALVGKDGKVKKTVIMKREPEVAYLFDEQARKWAMKCTFTPALDKGSPVAVWVAIPISFKIPDFEPPVCTEMPQPEYPPEAIEQGLEGWVGVAILVDENGLTIGSKALVVGREPMYTQIFDDAAKDVAKNAKFKPAEGRSGRAKGWVFLKVEFSLPTK